MIHMHNSCIPPSHCTVPPIIPPLRPPPKTKACISRRKVNTNQPRDNAHACKCSPKSRRLRLGGLLTSAAAFLLDLAVEELHIRRCVRWVLMSRHDRAMATPSVLRRRDDVGVAGMFLGIETCRRCTGYGAVEGRPRTPRVLCMYQGTNPLTFSCRDTRRKDSSTHPYGQGWEA